MDLSKVWQPVSGKAEVSLFIAQEFSPEADILVEWDKVT